MKPYPVKFYEEPPKLKSILTQKEREEVENILKEYNYLNTPYNGNISKPKFWAARNPKLWERMRKDIERYQNYYHDIKITIYLKKILFNLYPYKTFNYRIFKDWEDFCKRAVIYEVKNGHAYGKYVREQTFLNFQPKNLSELYYCYFYNLKDRPKCKYCGEKETAFKGLEWGYGAFCSHDCQWTHHNTQKPIKHSDLPDSELRKIIFSVAPDNRYLNNEKIADIYLNIYEYSQEYNDLDVKERIYLFAYQIPPLESRCKGCGEKKLFISQTRGFKKSCGKPGCIFLGRNYRPMKEGVYITNNKKSSNSIRTKEAFIYLMYSESLKSYKIGIALSPLDRLKYLKHLVPDLKLLYALYICNAKECEKELHDYFRDKQARFDEYFEGSAEYFYLTAEDINYIKDFVNGMQLGLQN